MKLLQLIPITVLGLSLMACVPTEKKEEKKTPPVREELTSKTDQKKIIYSFAFVGCNRVDRGDQDNKEATNATSANEYVLKRIFNEIVAEETKPDLFFFLGDLVYAESTTQLLNAQLEAWKKQYKDTSFSSLSVSGIEMIAVPGNHEMLSWADHNVQGHDEWPLKGATEIWMNYMGEYMPSDRDKVGGVDSMLNQMTFAFTRGNVGFVVMNTDTYNAPTKQNPYGLEGQIPTPWIVDKIKMYQADESIEHVFVLGHKPYYVNGDTSTGHTGLPEGPVLWPEMVRTHTTAMLSAHLHDYQRMQPGDSGTYQIIAGNGGSSGSAEFFGYSTINIWSNGEVELISKGFTKGVPYYAAVPNNPTIIQDQTILTWSKNANPYKNNF